MAKLNHIVRGRRLAAMLALLSALVLVAASCGGGGGSGPVIGPGDPVIPIVPADDHGDTRSDATDLALGSSVEGQIEEGDDDDYFRVQVAEAGTLTVYTTGTLNTVGELQADDGSILARDNDGGDDGNFRIEHDVGPGTYYVAVSSYDTNTGNYVVLARFTPAELPPPPRDEHGNTRSDATDLVLGSMVSGQLHDGNDEDYFRFNLAEPSTVSVTLTARPGIEVAFLDSEGTVLATAVTASDANAIVTIGGGEKFIRVRWREVPISESIDDPYQLIATAKGVAQNIRNVINLIRGIPDFTITRGRFSFSIDLSEYFEAPSGSPISFQASASVSGKVSIAVAVERSTLTISRLPGARPGPVTITVTATVPGVPIAVDVFVTVVEAPNQPPETTTHGFNEEHQFSAGETYTRPLSIFFVDDTPEKLTYTLEIVEERGEGWDVEIVGTSLEVRSQVGMKAGDVVIFRVTATDPEGLSATQQFVVEIVTGPRVKEGKVLELPVQAGDDLEITLTDYIEDPIGGSLNFALGPIPDLLGVTLDGPIMTVVTQLNTPEGGRTVRFTATDQDGRSAEFGFLVIVEIETGPRVKEGKILELPVQAGDDLEISLTDYIEDPEGGPLTFALGLIPDLLGVTLDGPIMTVVTQPNTPEGGRTVRFTATDQDERSAEFGFLVVVDSGNCRDYFGSTFKYVGQCNEGVPHGQGTLYYSDGTKFYEGGWSNGQRHGQGTSYYENGNKRYEGEYKDGQHHGQGTMYHGNGNKFYEGEYKDGQHHGQGTLYHENGNKRYEGGWSNNAVRGQGTHYYENGNKRSEGEWRERRDGDGSVFWNGTIWQLDGECEAKYRDGNYVACDG